MARPRKGEPAGIPGGPKRGAAILTAAFWSLFSIAVIGLFFANRANIARTLEETRFVDRLLKRDAGRSAAASPMLQTPPPAVPALDDDAGEAVVEPASGEVVTPLPDAPVPEAVAERERSLYFIQIDADGAILRIRSPRALPTTDAPLTGVLLALLAGPTAEEQARGLRSLIPADTRLLGASIRGGTAYVSFSEDFQFNVYGVEGYAASLRQIVWTATEFPTVKDVQVLIEGRRVEYLGEGIWIGSPLNRESL